MNGKVSTYTKSQWWCPMVLVLCIFSCAPDQGSNDYTSLGGSAQGDAPPTLPPPETDYEEAENKWGFADSLGRLQIPGQFDEVRPFTEEGLALVRKNGRWHFIDARGEQVGQDWRAAWPYSEGLARVQSDEDLIGFIGETAQVAILPTFLSAGDFQEGHAWVRTVSGFGLIDAEGQTVIEPQYEKLSDLTNGRLVFKQAEKYGLRDLDQILIAPQYDRLTDDGDLLRAREGRLYGYLQPDGEWMIEPAYQMASPFANGRATVLKEGEWQLIDVSGRNLLAADYQQLFPAGEQLWVVEADGAYGAVNADGRVVIDLVYDEIQPFSSGLAVYNKSNLWGYLEPDGTQAFPPEFMLAWPFKGELARVATRNGFVIIDKAGTVRIRPGYRDLRVFGELGLVPVQLFR
ncbi:MAG: WG repeat-containing protein [Bacteroidota bacterium]